MLFMLRSLLVLGPALGAMLLQSYESYSLFTFFILLHLLIVEAHRKLASNEWALAILLAESAYAAWMSHHYGSILFMTFFAALFAYLPYSSFVNWKPLLLLQLILMNISLAGSPPVYWVIANLLFVALSALLLKLRSTSKSMLDVEEQSDLLLLKHRELGEARKQLIEYARNVEDSAQKEERNRISRDIHDDLGHKLIRLKLMMDAAVQVLPNQPDKGMEIVQSVRDQLSDSMELLRSTVRKLKPDERTMQAYSLTQLIKELGTGAGQGITVRHRIEGMPYALYPSLEFILYRNAQEAVTNAIRHGSASEALITLEYEPKQVVMNVTNNGKPPEGDWVRGLGLRGMEERVSLVGGRLEVVVEPIFTVRTVLPTYRNEAN
ncbi:sensor histidine kinase [Cohnella faecalis]|uniref:histidine kinase n=1 Tax=Cohnella faecalis TaxID=2315694 RepID=A0A398CK26_9BACL|nr:sensor histidine kinase [Cohnella faecalis]RIE00237.1 sensor histidine kinase [Cohnella faecalis]